MASPSLDPARWPLSPEGRAAARRTGRRLPAGALVLSSAEVKAVETAQLATGAAPVLDDRFGEVRRPGEPFDSQVRARRRAWVGGTPDARHRGWESLSAAGTRFDQAVREHLAGCDGDLVIAAHGMVITAWLVVTDRLEAGEEAACFWEGLCFPDLLGAEVEAGRAPGQNG
ncbi:histidine phosphatase family protein [Brachybacterium hainanense]|uniref:Histidine phosphatase family protein n=1 Tax=Brachybacterium hainanense TaxID=1541174 RepID=A0ABV6RER0_9MICO